MATLLRPLAVPFAAFTIIIILAVLALHATQAFAEPSGGVQYAEYRSDRWHFSLAVPDDMTVAAYDQAGDGQTIQFIDKAREFEFQVSAWPYTQLDLTLDRVGDPSGTTDQPDHLEIVDVVRDDTFTVLFQKNGIRYAVVALPDRETWLINILKSWEFN